MSIEAVIHQLEEAKKNQQTFKGDELQAMELEKKIRACKSIVFVEITRLTRSPSWKDDPLVVKQACRLGAILWDKYDTHEITVDLRKSS